MSQLWMIAYDIADDDVRGRVHDLLKNYGARVQYSVFECRLDKAALQSLRSRVNEEIGQSDQVRWYPLCAWCSERISWQGSGMPPENEPFFLL